MEKKRVTCVACEYCGGWITSVLSDSGVCYFCQWKKRGKEISSLKTEVSAAKKELEDVRLKAAKLIQQANESYEAQKHNHGIARQGLCDEETDHDYTRKILSLANTKIEGYQRILNAIAADVGENYPI